MVAHVDRIKVNLRFTVSIVLLRKEAKKNITALQNAGGIIGKINSFTLQFRILKMAFPR